MLFAAWQGNVGDSRAVASVAGEVEQLSFDHKPSNEVESRRIIAAGGWVEFNRVNGALFHPACTEPWLLYDLGVERAGKSSAKELGRVELCTFLSSI